MIDLRDAILAMDVVAVGHVTHDRYAAELVPGGCAYFGARAAQVLGAQVRFLTAVGEDFALGADLKDMEVLRVTGGATTVFTNEYPPGQPRRQLLETQAPMIDCGDFPSAWARPDVLFLAPVMGEIDPSKPWVSTVDARFVALSMQGFLKKGEGESGRREVVRNPRPLPKSLFEGVDAVFLSEEEIHFFVDDGFLDDLRCRVPLVFVTLGEKGCRIYTPDRVFHTGVYKTQAEDPTGAGDTFAMSATLALAAGLPSEQAALLGAAAASIVVEGTGSFPLANLQQAYPRFGSLVQEKAGRES